MLRGVRVACGWLAGITDQCMGWSSRIMKRSLGSCLAGIGIVVCSQAPVIAAHAQTDAPEWDTRFVDRHPDSDDLKLPMPCGGSMVFRPVDVATGKTVPGDVEIMTGRNDAVDGYNEFLHKSWISAPFPVPGKPDLRRYYVAKYDVTQNLYDAVMHPDAACRPPTAEGMKPAIRVSWFDAQNFTATWTSWLLAHHAATLPTHGDGHGFVRLPTEDEWSYAARGGMQVCRRISWPRHGPCPKATIIISLPVPISARSSRLVP